MDKLSAVALADKNYMSLVQDIFDNANFAELEHFQHHSKSTRLDHCIHVSYSCYKHYIIKRHRYRYAKDSIRGALLHDFFLYDYKEAENSKQHWLHGFFHPKVSLINAEHEFTLTKIERNVILRHMFPLTPIPPKCRAAWWVVIYDKFWAIRERFGRC